MGSISRRGWLRATLILVFSALAALVYRSVPASSVRAVPEDPDTFWSIGKPDNSSDEFAPGSARSLTYEAGKSAPHTDWRQRQDSSDADPPLYKIAFTLNAVPGSAPLLALDYYFLGLSPHQAEISVNGKRGRFRIQPAAGQNLDERQANNITYSRQQLRVPLEPALLRAGGNEIGFSFLGEGGAVQWDSLALRKSGGSGEALAAAVEPTIFFRRRGDQLKEVVDVVVRHHSPIGKLAAVLEVAGATIKQESATEPRDFGEETIEVEAPALAAPAPYRLAIMAGGKTTRFEGVLRPEKRWRIFAGLKIHNDIGYTDLQPHIQELDARNTDRLLELTRQFSFYKFNLETTWLVENYLQSRSAERTKELMSLAARDVVGINALYLNLMTGMTTGEELHRALYESKSLQKKYGIPLKFACLTDAPSHTWFVPTLLADAGVKGFALGSNQTRAPLLQNSSLNEDSPFWWEGPDGARVMAWFARSYLQFGRLIGTQPSVDRLRRSVPQFLARYRRADYPTDSVLLYGLYTDNAAIRDGEAEILKQWNEAYAFPKITPATDADYYDHLAKNFAEKLPVYRGDGGAYWEDGAGSTAAETAINRDSQRLLPAAETAAALATAFRPDERYPAGEFREAWKNLMFYDEHTWGASRSISQPDRRLVTDQWDFKRAYANRAHWTAKDLLYRSLNRLVQNISVDGPTLFVFNPGISDRTGAVEIEIDPRRQLVDLSTGATVAAQVVRETDGYQVRRFIAREVPGLGYRAYGVRSAETAARPPALQSRSWQIESRYYRVRLDPSSGGIAELFDKELSRDLVDAGAAYKLNQLLYVSGGERSRILQDLLTLKPAQLELSGQWGASVASNDGHRIVVRAQAKNVPAIESEIVLHDAVKRIDIVNRIRKEDTRAKEAVYFAFPFRVSPPEVAYQVQNAWVRPDTDQLPGACRDWFTTQNVALARDAGATIAFATPDSPFVTFGDINRGRWLKKLDVRNGHVLSYVMNNYWFTNYKAAQGGDFTFRYAITSGRRLTDEGLARFDSETRSPLIAYDYYETGNVRIEPARRAMPAASGQFLQIRAGNAQMTAFKQAEDGNGFILRLRETAGKKGEACIQSPVLALAAARRTNGVEDDRATLPVVDNAVTVPLEPHQFTTVRLLLRAAR